MTSKEPREITYQKEESLHTPSSFMTEMEACWVRGNQLRDGRIFLEALITLIFKVITSSSNEVGLEGVSG